MFITSCSPSLVVEHFCAIPQHVADKNEILSDGTSIRKELCLFRLAILHDVPEVARRYRRLDFFWCTDRDESRGVARCGVRGRVGR